MSLWTVNIYKVIMSLVIIGVGASSAVWTRGLINYIHGIDIVYNWSKFTIFGATVGATVAVAILFAMSYYSPKEGRHNE